METLSVDNTNSPLKKFFSAFGFKLITVSVIPPKGVKVPFGKWFDATNWIRAIPYKEFFTESIQLEIQACNAAGCAIYFTVNEGNGAPKEPEKGNFNCGRNENIHTLRAVFIDTDAADEKVLITKLKEIKLAPHIIVESSPNKFHYYFLINPEKTEGDALIYWHALQKLLASLVPDLDQTMNEVSQVLRIPGFLNLKYQEPFKVRVKAAGEHAPYDLKALFDRLGAHNYIVEHKVAVNGSHSDTYKKFEFPTTYLTEGNRRDTICRYIDRLMENILPLNAKEEEYFMHVNAFIKQYVKPDQQYLFLEGGERRQNLISYYNDQLKYRVKKHYDLQVLIASQNFQHIEDVESKSLPDEFYLFFPGDLGMLVREIHAYTPTLSLELCFAGALMISGALKSETFRYNGSWPFINGLIIAGTGAGKSALKDIVERTLESCGLRGKYPQLFGFQNSVQSLHTALYTAGGSGTTIIDESGDYLQTITAKHAPAYAKALKKYFKESTTGKDQGTWLHPGGSLSYSVPPINGGMLSLWMLIQPDKFMGSLSLEDMADGFLPRFFIFNGKTTINLTRFMNKQAGTETFAPSMDLKVYLESLVHLMPCLEVSSVIETTEKEFKEANPKAKADAVYVAKRDAVYTARSEARKMKSIKVEIHPEAHTAIETYLKEQEKAWSVSLSKNGESDPSQGVYARMEEMLMRLLCNAVSWNHSTKQAVIANELTKACIRFHKFQTDRFFSNELSEISKGSGEREEEIVLKGLINAFVRKGKKPVRLGEITTAIRSTKRPKNISFVVQELVKQGKAIIQEKISEKETKHKVRYYIPMEEEDYEPQDC